MDLKLFYHVTDLPGWEDITNEQLARVKNSGLLDNCELHINLHFNPNSFDQLRKEWNQYSNIVWYYSKYQKEDWELPTYVLMQQTALNTDKEFYALYFKQKAINYYERQCGKDWRRLLDWFLIDNWRHMVDKLDEGNYDVVGINRKVDHWAGSSAWCTASFLRKCRPILGVGADVGYKSQLGRDSYKHDVEYYFAWNNDRYYSFFDSGNTNHYIDEFPEEIYNSFFKK